MENGRKLLRGIALAAIAVIGLYSQRFEILFDSV